MYQPGSREMTIVSRIKELKAIFPSWAAQVAAPVASLEMVYPNPGEYLSVLNSLVHSSGAVLKAAQRVFK
jgi:hypothetical protein